MSDCDSLDVVNSALSDDDSINAHLLEDDLDFTNELDEVNDQNFDNFDGSSNPRTRGRRRSSLFLNSIDAIIPRILVRQMLNTIENKTQITPEMARYEVKGKSIKKAIEKYRKTGSINRYLGALLFVDISGFTKLAQNYPIEDFKIFINLYFSEIINLIVDFGGEVVKFAGDALYALWSPDDGGLPPQEQHKINVAKCTACGIAINATCNDYKVSKAYPKGKTRVTVEFADPTHNTMEAEALDHVMYTAADVETQYETIETRLYVHSGVSEGEMVGVHINAADRSEFFLIGKPLEDVAIAEGLAGKGEIVISPSVYELLMNLSKDGEKNFVSPDSPSIKFNEVQDGFFKIISTENNESHLPDGISSFMTGPTYFPTIVKTVGDFSTRILNHKNNDDDSNDDVEAFEFFEVQGEINSCIMATLEYNRHEATREIHGRLTAELRRVVVLFMKIDYEPDLPKNADEDSRLLDRFQSIYTFITESISARQGQIRQFMNDDKGTICIASFGLRGSVSLDIAATATEAAQDIHEGLMQILNIECKIGITLGKVFCGETGSKERYEYSLLGPTVNLAARLMAKGTRPINCDEETKNNNHKHTFENTGAYQLKGYDDPVPIFSPIDDNREVSVKVKEKLIVRREEFRELASHICLKKEEFEKEPVIQPCAILASGMSGTGKTEFINAVLNDPTVKNNTFVMEANTCYHKDPFYCFSPIITRILLNCEKVNKKIVKLKKMYKHRQLSIPSSLRNLKIFGSPSVAGYDDLLHDDLIPYLGLINDFVYEGFPVFRITEALHELRESEKVGKCVELLSAMITHYVEQLKQTVIIVIQEMDGIDSYSKRLLQHVFNTNCKLIFVGSMTLTNESDLEQETSPFESIFGCTDRDYREMRLGYLSEDATFELFQWAMKDISDQDRELLDNVTIRSRVNKVCGGMPYFALELARAFSLLVVNNSREIPANMNERTSFLVNLLDRVPTSKIEELICFKFDNISSEGQMLLKVASVAGFDRHNFSQDLLEVLVSSLSETSVTSEPDKGLIPRSIGDQHLHLLNNIFQGHRFEKLLDSLVDQNILVRIESDVGDIGGRDTNYYRFVDDLEQSTINSLMLEDQKKIAHHHVAQYYRSILDGGVVTGGSDFSTANSSFSENLHPSLSWQMQHITALHYDLAGYSVQAMLKYFSSGTELARLGIRDRAHGSLLSAYLMFERRIHEARNFQIPHCDQEQMNRQHIVGRIYEIIGDKELPASMKTLTIEHLKLMFENDTSALTTCIQLLTKYGQSVGTIEKEGYKIGSDIYLQAIFLLLLALEEHGFQNMMSRVSRFIDKFEHGIVTDSHIQLGHNDEFYMEHPGVCFPAFSGLLTFYRDSPIPVNMNQETLLANLFVAITEESTEVVHQLRAKCILSHLYLKHGDIKRAIIETESLKTMYDHDEYSAVLVSKYGMDWALICIGTMTVEYLYRGDLVAGLNFIHFLEEQIGKLDEFASSTKVMMKQLVSSMYIILQNYDRAFELADGIAGVSYKYFYKPSGILHEILTKRMQALYCHENTDSYQMELHDKNEQQSDVLSILSLENPKCIRHNRSMLYSSIETLGDRGIEAINAAICMAEIKLIEARPVVLDHHDMSLQMKYCTAGLLYLEQSLQQADANSHEKRSNFISCLLQKAELLVWYKKLRCSLDKFGYDAEPCPLFGNNITEMESPESVLQKCKQLCQKYDYYLALLMIGVKYKELRLDESYGEEIICLVYKKIQSEKSCEDYAHAARLLERLQYGLRSCGINDVGKESCNLVASRDVFVEVSSLTSPFPCSEMQ